MPSIDHSETVELRRVLLAWVNQNRLRFWGATAAIFFCLCAVAFLAVPYATAVVWLAACVFALGAAGAALAAAGSWLAERRGTLPDGSEEGVERGFPIDLRDESQDPAQTSRPDEFARGNDRSGQSG